MAITPDDRKPRASGTAKTPGKGERAARRHKKHRRRSKPLKVTPPLESGRYVFPVVGPSGYGDSYGAFRSDVHGKWHHGDDIFAPLGTPVVAVTDGTLNRVGWKKIGGWRLWVEDSARDEFYYAHLSGYAPSDFHSKHVRAGQVIGFIGDTGDAFPGSPHLHFEIHPQQLLRLHYDGAVDPTTYLDSWQHLKSVATPRPVHPRLPKQPQLRREARFVFRELLAARHLITRPPKPSQPPPVALPEGARRSPMTLPSMYRAARASASPGSSPTLIFPLLAGLVSLVLLAATMLLARGWRGRRQRPAVLEEADADRTT